MTRYLVVLTLLALLLGCSKKSEQLGSVYLSLVGEWKPVDANSEPIRLVFKKNGKAVYKQAAERGTTYKVRELVELFPVAEPTDETIHSYLLRTNSKELVVSKKAGYVDTIETYLETVVIDSVGISKAIKYCRVH